MSEYEYKTQIRYNDISEENQLSGKGMLNILSEAAGLHSAQIGYGLNDKEKTNCAWMLLYWKIKILKRPRWKTELTVKTWVREITKIASWRDFEIYDETNEKVGIATTEWVLIDAKKETIGRITDEMKEKYGIEEKTVFEEKISGKLKEPEKMKKVCEYTAKRRDIDVNHHVNNVNYLEIAYDALPKDISTEFDNLEIYYKKQIKLRRDNRMFLHKRRK